jgi:hypothetical protein
MEKHCWLALIFLVAALIVAQVLWTGSDALSGWRLLLGLAVVAVAIGVIVRRIVHLKGMRRIWFAVICLVLTIVSVVSYVLLVPDEFIWRVEISQGDALVRAIESYRRQHGRVPASLREVGASDLDQPIFYQGCDDNRYILSFPMRLGEYMSYDSSLRRWWPADQVCGPPMLPENQHPNNQGR